MGFASGYFSVPYRGLYFLAPFSVGMFFACLSLVMVVTLYCLHRTKTVKKMMVFDTTTVATDDLSYFPKNVDVPMSGVLWIFFNFFVFFGSCCFVFVLLFISMFDYIPFYVAGLLECIFMVLVGQLRWGWFQHARAAIWGTNPNANIYHDNSADEEELEYQNPEELSENIKQKGPPPSSLSFIILYAVLVICFLVFTFSLTWFMSSACITLNPNSFSTLGIRRLLNDDPCETDLWPCHVYVTYGSQMASEIIVHFHSGIKYQAPVIFITSSKKFHGNETVSAHEIETWSQYSAGTYRLSEISHLTERYVYYARVTQLTPSETYYFVVGDEGYHKTYSKVKKIRMGPDDSSTFSFAVGGDVGVTPNVQTMLKNLNMHEPLFFALGGDIAYARWDAVLDLFEEGLVTPSGYTIPIITAIGNHEAGALYAETPYQAPFYYPYFTHEYLDVLNKLPYDLPSYHAHYVGDTSAIYSLDSNIVSTSDGKQAEWMDTKLGSDSRRGITNKFALYHVGLYPSVRDPNEEIHTRLRKDWIPLFDKYKVKVAFENHDQTYKRTKPMYNNTPVTQHTNGSNWKGTLYMGDGAFGVASTTDDVVVAEREYLDKVEFKSHVLFATVTKESVTIEAMSTEGRVFDRYVIPTNHHEDDGQ